MQSICGTDLGATLAATSVKVHETFTLAYKESLAPSKAPLSLKRCQWDACLAEMRLGCTAGGTVVVSLANNHACQITVCIQHKSCPTQKGAVRWPCLCTKQFHLPAALGLFPPQGGFRQGPKRAQGRRTGSPVIGPGYPANSSPPLCAARILQNIM